MFSVNPKPSLKWVEETYLPELSEVMFKANEIGATDIANSLASIEKEIRRKSLMPRPERVSEKVGLAIDIECLQLEGWLKSARILIANFVVQARGKAAAHTTNSQNKEKIEEQLIEILRHKNILLIDNPELKGKALQRAIANRLPLNKNGNRISNKTIERKLKELDKR